MSTHTLSLADRLDLQDIYARAAYYMDFGEPDKYVALYTSDGTFARFAAGKEVFRRSGSAELRAFAVGVIERNAGLAQHWMSNVFVDATADGAVGTGHTMLVGTIKDNWTCNVLLIGQYRDVFVRTPDGWRIRERTVHGPR